MKYLNAEFVRHLQATDTKQAKQILKRYTRKGFNNIVINNGIFYIEQFTRHDILPMTVKNYVISWAKKKGYKHFDDITAEKTQHE